MEIKNVTLVGAAGHLGGAVLAALVSSGIFRITILRRESSQGGTAGGDSVHIVTVPDAWDEADLTAALRGQDAVVACFRLKGDPPAAHLTLASAAAAAGVLRYIPADFGSVDARSEYARELVPLFSRKEAVRKHLQKLSSREPPEPGRPFTWTSIVCGHFFDWGLKENFLHFDLHLRKAEILDRGEQRSSLSTLAQVGRAVVAVLRRPDETRDRVVFIQSFCVSQNDVLASLERVTGGRPWDREVFTSEDFVKKHVALRDAGSTQAIEDLVFALGVIDGDWQAKEDFAMDLLGLQAEDLDAVVRRVYEEVRTESKSSDKAP